jgi:RNA polymerase sigma-70 factor, ECF subfamily
VTAPVHDLVDHLFRHRAGQMVASLTRVLGSANLALAEEVVQDALIAAMQTWPMRGVPEDPGGWLFKVARNRALDVLRRQTSLREKEPHIAALFDRAAADDAAFAHELRDDQLRMMLMCCHPAIAEESRIALTLKTVGGFSVAEIARAFLAREETIAQRLVRAKRLIRDENIPMEMPASTEMPGRLQSVLKVLYLLFNEGYNAHAGEELIRQDLCHEAIRLASIVADHGVASTPAADALLALMLLQASRLPARVDGAGELMTLAVQDRNQWDRSLLSEGMQRLERSASGDAISTYHLEAAIAACHSAATTFESTDWRRLIELYDELLLIRNSPVVALNRAVAVAMADGAPAGIRAIEEIAAHQSLRDYLPLASTLGELWLRSGDRTKAAEHFRRALDLPATTPEKRFLLKKLGECSA